MQMGAPMAYRLFMKRLASPGSMMLASPYDVAVLERNRIRPGTRRGAAPGVRAVVRGCLLLSLGFVSVPASALAESQAAPEQPVETCSDQQNQANAVDGPRDADILSHSADEELRARLLADPRPVCLSIGELRLRIPRNYLYSHSSWAGDRQEEVTLEVTYPGLQPFNEQTRACFEKGYPCPLQQITIMDSAQSSDTIFQGMRPLFSKQKSMKSLYGYDAYSVGPPDQRIEFFTKPVSSGNLTFDCFPPVPEDGFPGLCSRSMPFMLHTTVFYRFSYTSIPEQEHRDARLYELAQSFVIKREQR